MAHGLTATDHMVSAQGIRPWHGLGVNLPERLTEREQVEFLLRSLRLDPDLEVRSIRGKIEAAKAALAWERTQSTGVPGSLWTAFQGVTHCQAHEKASKGSGTQAGLERRMASTVLDGERSRLATQAFEKAARLAGAR